MVVSVVGAQSLEQVTTRYPDGALRERYHVDAALVRQGLATEYWATGRTLRRGNFKDGKLHGRVERFYENGARQVTAYYRDGILHGAYEEFDGAFHLRGRCEAGALHGRVEVSYGSEAKSQRVYDHGHLSRVGTSEVYARSVDDLRRDLAAIEVQMPGTADNSTKEAERARGLARLNAYRYLCGLPHDVILDEVMVRHAEAAASLCKALGRLDHTPANPGWPRERFDDAYEGTSHSNLAVTSDLAQSIDQYMNDSDPSNIDRVGHRRWCLNPAMQRTGLGREDRFAAMWSMDSSRKSVPRPDWVAYPPAGYVPLEYFGPRHAWSLSFGPGVARKKLAEARVQIFRLEDRFLRTGPALALDTKHVAGGGFGGSSACLVFRSPAAVVEDGARYEVVIDTDASKRREVLAHYFVDFVDLTRAAPAANGTRR